MSNTDQNNEEMKIYKQMCPFINFLFICAWLYKTGGGWGRGRGKIDEEI